MHFFPIEGDIDSDCSSAYPQYVFAHEFCILFALKVGHVLANVVDAIGAVEFVTVEDLIDFGWFGDVVDGEGEILLSSEDIGGEEEESVAITETVVS